MLSENIQSRTVLQFLKTPLESCSTSPMSTISSFQLSFSKLSCHTLGMHSLLLPQLCKYSFDYKCVPSGLGCQTSIPGSSIFPRLAFLMLGVCLNWHFPFPVNSTYGQGVKKFKLYRRIYNKKSIPPTLSPLDPRSPLQRQPPTPGTFSVYTSIEAYMSPHTLFCTRTHLEMALYQHTQSCLLFSSCLAFHCANVPKPI